MFNQIQAKALNIFMTNVHKHCSKGLANLVPRTAHITAPFMHILVALLCTSGHKSQNVALYTNSWDEIQAEALNKFMTHARKHFSKGLAQFVS